MKIECIPEKCWSLMQKSMLRCEGLGVGNSNHWHWWLGQFFLPDLPILVNCQACHTPLFPCPCPFPYSFYPTSSLSSPSAFSLTPFLFSLSLPLSILPLPHPLPQIQLVSLGERCKLPHRVRAKLGCQTHFDAMEAKTWYTVLGWHWALQNG